MVRVQLQPPSKDPIMYQTQNNNRRNNGGCDDIEALKKAMGKDSAYSCHSAQFSIISAIDNKLETSPLNWSWRHVKGHQKEHMG
eukprot:1715063-Ditylum_brightwellii.AAC.1